MRLRSRCSSRRRPPSPSRGFSAAWGLAPAMMRSIPGADGLDVVGKMAPQDGHLAAASTTRPGVSRWSMLYPTPCRHGFVVAVAREGGLAAETHSPVRAPAGGGPPGSPPLSAAARRTADAHLHGPSLRGRGREAPRPGGPARGRAGARGPSRPLGGGRSVDPALAQLAPMVGRPRVSPPGVARRRAKDLHPRPRFAPPPGGATVAAWVQAEDDAWRAGRNMGPRGAIPRRGRC